MNQRRRHCAENSRHRGFALLMSVLLVTLLIAVTAELVTSTSVQSLVVQCRHHALAHELAVDSALIVLTDRLGAGDDTSNPWMAALDASDETSMDFAIGRIAVRCTIRDDASKFSPRLFQQPTQQPMLTRKLETLAAKLALPQAKVLLRPIAHDRSASMEMLYHSYDQLLDDVGPGDLLRLPDENIGLGPVWSDAVTLWGDGRIDLRRVHPEVLEAALEDMRPGLARAMLAARPAQPSNHWLDAALTRVDAEIRRQVAARVALDVRRFAVSMDTMDHGDRRRWYVVAVIKRGTCTVLHRSQVTW